MTGQKKSYEELVSENEKLKLKVDQLSSSNNLYKPDEYPLGLEPKLAQTVFEQVNLGLAILSRNGYFTQCNQKFTEMLGYSNTELKEMAYPCLTYPEDIEIDKSIAEQIKEGTKSSFSVQKRLVRKNGNVIWANIWVNVTRASDGRVDLVIGAFKDITKKKRMKLVEDIVLELHEKFESVSVNGLFENVLEKASVLTDSHTAFFFLIDGYSNEVTLKSFSKNAEPGIEVRGKVEERRMDISELGDWKKCLVAKKTIVLSSKERIEKPPIDMNCTLLSPIIEKDKVIAVLGVGGKANCYNSLDSKVMGFLVSNLWLLVQRKKAEEKFSKVFHINPAMSAIVDLYTDRFIEVNGTFYQKLGYQPEQVFGVSVTQLFGLSEEIKAKGFGELKQKGYISNIELDLKTATGSTIPFLVSGETVVLEGKKFLYLVAVDITQKKIAEQELVENEITLNAIFDHAPVIMLLIDKNKQIIKINRTVKKLKPKIDVPNEKITCAKILGCVSQRSLAGPNNDTDLCQSCIIDKTINETFQTGQGVYKKEADIITVEDSEISLKTYLVSSALIEMGGNAKVLLTFDEITLQKKIEEELLLSKEKSAYNEKRYRLLANLTFEGIMLHQNMKIIDVNKALSEMTGYSYTELIGQKSNSFIFPDEYAGFLEKKLEEEYSLPYETEIVEKNGKTIPVEIESRYFRQNDQRIRVSAIRDITERKLGEKRILQAVVQTEENERARFAQELHDGLGPILSNVQMYFQWLAEADDNEQFVFEKGNLSLKNAFATLREISNNLSPHILHNFGLVHAISNFIESIAIKDIKVDFKTNIDSKRFDSDIEISLYRIVTELINNTLKYSGANLISIKFEKDKNLLTTIYSDNGKGFDIKEIQEKGRGFGMINIKNRVKVIHATMEMKSAPNKGMNVKISVPLKRN